MDWSLIWNIAGGPFVGGIIALLGVVIAQKINTKNIEKQLEQNRALKQMELKAEAANAVRRDRKDAYVNLLKAWEGCIEYVEKLGEMGINSPLLQLKVAKLIEQLPKTDEATIEVKAYGSAKVIGLAVELQKALGRCLDAYHLAEQQAQNASYMAQQEFGRQDMEDLYGALLSQIRIELSSSDSPDFTPTPEEIRALAEQILEDIPESSEQSTGSQNDNTRPVS
jgi:hypothetical protein